MTGPERQASPTRARTAARALGDSGPLPLVILFGLNVVDEFDRVAFGVLAPEIRDAFDLSNAQLVSIVSITAATAISLSVPLAYLADRSSRLRLVRLGALTWGLAGILLGLAPTVAIIVVARFMGGVGVLVNQPVHSSLLADYYPASVHPGVFGVHRFANNVGILAGPIAGALAMVWGWRLTFVVLALPTFGLLLASRRLPEPVRGTFAGTGAALDVDAPRMLASFRQLRSVAPLRKNWLAFFLIGAGLLPFGSLLQLFLEEEYNLSPAGRGAASAFLGLGMAAGLLGGARLGQRLVSAGDLARLPVLVSICMVEFGLAVAGIALSPWVGLTLAFTPVAGLGAGALFPPYLTMIAVLSPAQILSQAYAWSLLVAAVGGALFAGLAGAIGDSAGLRAGLLTLVPFFLAAGLAELRVRRPMEAHLAAIPTDQAPPTHQRLASHVEFEDAAMFDELTVGELRELARTAGVIGRSRMRKADLVRALSTQTERDRPPIAENASDAPLGRTHCR